MSLEEQVRHILSEAGGRLKVKSALNPVLWMCLIITVPAICFAPYYQGGAPTWYIILAFIPVIIASIGYLFLLFYDRDKLQSEDYQIRKRSLELIQEKGNMFPMKPVALDLITNPELSQITSKEVTKK